MSLMRRSLLLAGVISSCFSINEAVGATIEFPHLPSIVPTECDLPRVLKIDIHAEDDTISLDLTRSKSVGENVDLFLIRKGPDGKLIFVKDTSLGKMKEVLYQDILNEAEFEVNCSKSDNAATALVLDGTVKLSDGKLYTVEKSIVSNEYTLTEEKMDTSSRASDEVVDVDSNLNPTYYRHIRSAVRSKRAITTDIFIDGIAIIGKSVYDRFFSRSTETTDESKRTDALTSLRRKFAHIFNAVNLRFKTASQKLNINLIGFMVEEDISLDLVDGSNPTRIDSNKLLEKHVLLGKSTGFPEHDFLVSFTSLEMYRVEGDTENDAVLGLSYVGQICKEDGKNVLTVEYTDGFSKDVLTLAHEIGHNFGAPHDGPDENTCNGDDSFIMSPISRHVVSTNPFKFSTCSADYFDTHVTTLVDSGSTYSSNCLQQSLQSNEIPDVSDEEFGQVHNPDEQCKIIYGSPSRHCETINITDTTICMKMYCLDPDKDKSCFPHYAARGTSCGDKQWCEGGQCVPTPCLQKCTSPQILNKATCQCEDTDTCKTVKLYNLCGTYWGSICGC